MKTRNNRLFGSMQTPAFFVALALGASAACSFAQDPEPEPPSRVLLKSIYRLGIVEQTAVQARKLVGPSESGLGDEVESAVKVFRSEVGEKIRSELEDAFGASARDEFGNFIEAFSQAESKADADFLARVVGSAGEWNQTPTTYEALRREMVQDVLKDDVATAGNFLAEIQTWLDLRKKSEDVPGLRSWLDRGQPLQPVVKPAPPPPRKRNPLRDAEAVAKEYEPVNDDEVGALESFGAARAERRKKALEDARAGMQQVAEERRSAEEEAAAKKMAAAQAEADAVRKHAETLAAAESEAIEQRRNSWSGRLKSILSTTISATSGAFLGNVGSRAGEAAADAVFNTDSGRHR